MPQGKPKPLDPDLLNAAYSPPARKPSRTFDKFQPENSNWSLDRIPEIQRDFASQFGRSLPLVNKGQGSIHNRWKYDHRGSADVSINPASPEGQKFTAYLRSKNIPFLAFDRPVAGVSTGRHYHLGFPSSKTSQTFGVGAQQKRSRQLDPDLLSAAYGEPQEVTQTPAQAQTPDLDPDLLEAAYSDVQSDVLRKTLKTPQASVAMSEGAEMASPQEIAAEAQQRAQIKPLQFQQGNSTPRKAGPTELMMQPFDSPPKGTAKQELAQNRYQTPPSTELSAAVKIPFAPHLNPTADDVERGYLESLGPDYVKYGEKYKAETGRNILSLGAGDLDRDPDGSIYVKPTRAAIDVLNAYVKSGGDIEAAKAEGARIAAERRGAVSEAEQQAAPDIAAVRAGRIGLGQMSDVALPTPAGVPVPARSVVSPLIGYGGAKLAQIGGLLSGFGIAPNSASKYFETQGKIMELGASQAPLTPAGETIQRSVPEKVATGLTHLGLGVADILLLKKGTGLSTGQVMALESLAHDADLPVGQRTANAAQAYALGKILDGHLNRAMSSAIFAVPTAVEGTQQVARGEKSKTDVLIDTLIQGGTGALLAGKSKTEKPIELGLREGANEKVETQPNVAAQPEVATMRDNTRPARMVVDAETRIGDGEPAPRHVDLQRRLDDGTFGKETRVEKEERRAQVETPAEPAQPVRAPEVAATQTRTAVEPLEAAQPVKAETTAIPPEKAPAVPSEGEVSPDKKIADLKYRISLFDKESEGNQSQYSRDRLAELRKELAEATAPKVEGGVSKAPALESARVPVRGGNLASENVLTQSQNASGSGQHEIARLIQGNPKWKEHVLRELGEGAAPLDASGEFASPSSAAFRAANGDIVTIRSSYAQDKPPTLGTQREGIIIERKSAPPVESAPEAKPTGVSVAEGSAEAKPSEPPPSTTSARKVEPITPAPETATSRLARGVEAKAVEANLTQSFEGLSEYETVKVKDQTERAISLLDSDPAKAKRIAMGQESPPANVLPESVFTAVENRALERGDVETLRDLATASTRPAEGSVMGQRIRMLAERNPNSAVSAMRDVQLAREKRVAKKFGNIEKAKNRIKTEIQVEVKRAAPKAREWTKFLDEVACR